jgi:tRNA A37 threonylcarbamoyladenosine synthetase subunit TsaC/SUA5/YrdC
MAQLAPVLDLVLDAGAVTSPVVSTILDVTVEPPCVYRHGKIAQHALEAVLGYRVAQKKVDTGS